MKTIGLSLILLALGQSAEDDIDRLIQLLGSENVEKRSLAEGNLIRLGEKARAGLRRAAGSDDMEVRARASALLKILDLYRDLRPWYSLETRVTLAGQYTLREAVREIERQSGQKVTGDELPGDTFKIDLRDVPFWDALEAIARASGKKRLSPGKDGPSLVGDRWVRVPSKVVGPFRISVGSSSTYRRFDVSSGSTETTFTLGVLVSWEKSIEPVRSYLALSSVRDDTGNDLTTGFHEYAKRIFAGYSPQFLEKKRIYIKGFAPTTTTSPAPNAKSLDLKGAVTLYVRGSDRELVLPIPAKGEDSQSTMDVYDESLEEKRTARLVLSGFSREKTSVTCRLKVENIDPRLVADLYNHLYLRDGAGSRYQGTPRTIAKPDDGRDFTLHFDGVPASAHLTALVVRLHPRLVRKDISFAFKGIPLP